MKLHEKIKKMRKEKGWSQADLAQRIGIHGGHVSRLEGKKFQPSLEVLKTLAKVFEVSTDYLINESDELEEVRIEDQALAEKIKLLNTIEGKDKDTIIHMIDTILTKRKMVELLSKELDVNH